MKTAQVEVKSKSTVVGTAEYPVFDTTAEAIENLGGEAVVLERLNAQVRTDAMNKVRSAATGKITKAQLTRMAFAKMATDTELNERARALGGDPTALDLLINEICDGIQKEHTESLQAKASEATETPADVEEDSEEDDEE